MKVGLCRHFPNIKQVIIPIFFHIVNGFSTGFAGGFLYYNEKLARGKTPRAGFLLLYTAFQPHHRLHIRRTGEHIHSRGADGGIARLCKQLHIPGQGRRITGDVDNVAQTFR